MRIRIKEVDKQEDEIMKEVDKLAEMGYFPEIQKRKKEIEAAKEATAEVVSVPVPVSLIEDAKDAKADVESVPVAVSLKEEAKIAAAEVESVPVAESLNEL